MKLSLLEILTTPHVTPDILRRRAKHWATIADRLDAKRAGEAERIRANAQWMLRHADGASAPPATLPQATQRAPRAAKKCRASFANGRQFIAAVSEARRAAEAELGLMWGSFPGAAIWARLPAAWLAGTGHRFRDWRLPAARFWATGELPIGPEYAQPAEARAPHPEAVGMCDRTDPRYAAMLEAHRQAWNLEYDANGNLTAPIAAGASHAHQDQIVANREGSDRKGAEQLLDTQARNRARAAQKRLQELSSDALYWEEAR